MSGGGAGFEPVSGLLLVVGQDLTFEKQLLKQNPDECFVKSMAQGPNGPETE